MAELKTNIPDWVFPGEVDTLLFTLNPTAEPTLSLKISGGDELLFNSVLTPPRNGLLYVYDIASLLRDHIEKPTMIEFHFGTLLGTQKIKALCIPAQIDVKIPAMEFCKRCFFTRAAGRRWVTERSKIPFAFWPTPGDVPRVRVASVVENRKVFSDWKTITVGGVPDRLCSFTVDVAETLNAFGLQEEADLIEVEAGKRKTTLFLRDFRPGEIEVAFLGAFGQKEVAIFEHSEINDTAEIKMTLENGRRRAYQARETPTITATAPIIADGELDLYRDCISSKRHWLAKTGEEIVLTEAKIKDNGEATTAPSTEIKFQLKKTVGEFDFPPRIFDSSFDKTFE